MTRLFRSRVLAVLVALAVLATLSTQRPSPANAAGLTAVGWAVSNSQTSATGITYTWNFTPATTATLSSIAMTVPAGTVGTPAIAANWGIGAGSVGLSGATVTYTVTAPASVSSGTPIYIELSGFTNTGTAGSYTSDVTTDNGAPVDTGTSQSVTFGSSTTVAHVTVAKSLTLTNDTPAFRLLMDPGVAALADRNKNVTLTVKTNSGSGYSLAVKAGLLTNTSAQTIPVASSGIGTGVASGSFAPNTFGYSMTATAGNASGIAAQGAGLSVAGDYVGYTSVGETAAIATGPTGDAGDTIVLNNRVKINYDTPGGDYTSTITYTVAAGY
jgi:hypothetical protein